MAVALQYHKVSGHGNSKISNKPDVNKNLKWCKGGMDSPLQNVYRVKQAL